MSEKLTSRQIVQLVFAIGADRLSSRLAKLGGCEIGSDEDYGVFSLGGKT